MQRPPNILFLMTDQQSQSAMSCAGNRYLHTPHMDALAAGGISFVQSYCAAPVCGPSRSALVTGRLPHETGVVINNDPLAPTVSTCGELLRTAGYETAWTGVWHLSPEQEVRGYRYLAADPAINRRLGSALDAPTADAAIAFLDTPRDQPFFLGVSLFNPHDICYEIMALGDDLPPLESLPPLPVNFAIGDEPQFITECRARTSYGAEIQSTKKWSEHHWRAYLNIYDRLVEKVDAEVGRILGALRASGLEDDTLVVFTADHGEGMAAHQWVVKLMFWDNVMRVPFIVRPPGSATGGRPAGVTSTDCLVSGLDVVPTICDYAGIAPPPYARGCSLRPFIENGATPPREFVVAELAPFIDDPARQGRMVRSRRYKYIVFSDGANPEMLFDMQADPGETRNLAAETPYAEELVRHRAMLRAWLETTADTFTPPI